MKCIHDEDDTHLNNDEDDTNLNNDEVDTHLNIKYPGATSGVSSCV